MMNPSAIKIRHIESKDAESSRELYRFYVEKSSVSFEYDLPSEVEWSERILKNTAEYPWLVLEFENKVIGYAYASKHRVRTAYNWSVESAVYIEQNYHGLGIGKVLYSALFEVLRLQGYKNVYAGITLPNEKSVRLHQSMGFYEVGVFKKIGYKHGAWHDTGWYQLHLSDSDKAPCELKSTAEIQTDPQYQGILNNANKLLNLKYLGLAVKLKEMSLKVDLKLKQSRLEE